MNPYFTDGQISIYHGDALAVLSQMPESSIQCCVTSPPYWGLRDYGTAEQIGLERTPEEYITKMVQVFSEVKRVLRDDGTLWLNIGDCYATGAGAVGEHPGGGEQGARWKGEVSRHRDEKRRPSKNGRGESQVMQNHGKGRGTPSRADGSGGHVYVGPMTQPNRMPIKGLKPKDLVGIPWRLAFALQADGWYLRSDIIWSKPNPMPESVTDRPTKAHEYIFLMSKSERYHYDAEAVAEESVGTEYDRSMRPRDRLTGTPHLAARKYIKAGATLGSGTEKRNRRSVWMVPTQSFSEAHFATFPEDLILPCILAGCPTGGTVLDPFLGSGTTAVVAEMNGCKAVGIELNEDYIKIAMRRIGQKAIQFG